ncbi:unnamed protein product [Paramecium pentaurelia]|uniref:Uncharacterized protein n=1 Tax=Paramecium pentaurelia TaxID=43138 RepID=A0A8S1VK80_9CILI|nr:unnamed protein product [Paramecium pentaurelia]
MQECQKQLNLKVKVNGIGIDDHKLNQIQNSLHDTKKFRAGLKSHSGSKKAAKLIEGLTESKDNKQLYFKKKIKEQKFNFQQKINNQNPIFQNYRINR